MNYNNGKQESKRTGNGDRKHENESLYLVLEEKNENQKRNKNDSRGWSQ